MEARVELREASVPIVPCCVVLLEWSDSESLGAKDGFFFFSCEIDTRCDDANIRQMLFDFVSRLALHLGILCELPGRSQNKQSHAGLM